MNENRVLKWQSPDSPITHCQLSSDPSPTGKPKLLSTVHFITYKKSVDIFFVTFDLTNNRSILKILKCLLTDILRVNYL